MEILIITGGRTGESEISKRSAAFVEKVLKTDHKVTVVNFPENDLRSIDLERFDIAIPVIHGRGGEDGEVQTILEKLKLPYIFSPPKVHQICLDKPTTKKLVKKIGIRVANEYEADEVNFNRGKCIVKPFDGGSTLSTKVVNSLDELKYAVGEIVKSGSRPLIEDIIIGREFTVPVIDFPESTALDVVEIKKRDEIFDYEQKYNEAKLAVEILPAQIDDELRNLLQSKAREIHTALGCTDVSRSDFIVSESGEVYFLEINTIPGMTETSLLPKCLKYRNLDELDLFEFWMEKAMRKFSPG
jgi:D-alanine-D-alanine ligase